METTNMRRDVKTRALIAAGATLAAGVLVLGCETGTPAAPEGTEIPVTYEYISRDIPTGNFDAIISATVIDQDSDVPQVGVGVYFRVTGGPGQFVDTGPIETDEDGHAESVLVAHGATHTPSNKVSIEVSSGPTTAQLDIDVEGGFSETNQPPVASFTLNPNPPRAGQVATVDVGGSTDADCPGGDPTSWTVEWGEGSPTEGTFSNGTSATHTYPSSAAGSTYTIRVTVEDCTGLTHSTSRTVTLT